MLPISSSAFTWRALLPEQLGVGLDPYAISALVDELATRKIEGEMITGLRQGSALSPASWGMERKLKHGTLWHAGQPLMAWCVGEREDGAARQCDPHHEADRRQGEVDPLVAAFNAFMLMSRNPEMRSISVYDKLAEQAAA